MVRSRVEDTFVEHLDGQLIVIKRIIAVSTSQIDTRSRGIVLGNSRMLTSVHGSREEEWTRVSFRDCDPYNPTR